MVKSTKRAMLLTAVIATIAVHTSFAQATVVYWVGGSSGTNQTMTGSTNWQTTYGSYSSGSTGVPASGDAVVFDADMNANGANMGNSSHKLGAGLTALGSASTAWVFSSMTFKGSAMPGTLYIDNSISSASGYNTVNSITISGDGDASHDLVTLENTITGTIYFRGSMSVNDSSAALLVTLGKGNLNVVNSAATLRFNTVISGTDGLTKTGAGTLILAGANTYTGNTTIKAGTLQLNSAYALGDASNITTIEDARLQINAGSNWSSTRKFVLASANSVINTGTDSTAYNATINGIVSGGGSLNKGGIGKLTLTNVNTYSGATHVLAGTLSLEGDGSLANGNITVDSGATLTGDGTGIIHMNLSDSASDLITVASGGTLDITKLILDLSITGENSLDGLTLVSGGDYTGLTFAAVTGLSADYALEYGTDGITLVASSAPTPEAATASMLALGAGCLLFRGRRR